MTQAGPSARNLGRYKLVCELGKSWLGPRWAAVVESGEGQGLVAALRLISTKPPTAPGAIDALSEAAWWALELRGAGLDTVVDIVVDQGELGVVADYLEGEALRALLRLTGFRKVPMPPPVALRIALDVLDALGVVQERARADSISREWLGALTPDSVLVTTGGSARVLDVAVSAVAARTQPWRRNPEALGYLAPEVLRGEAADARADVWSVAVLVWEMLANRRLFMGTNSQAVEHAVLEGAIARIDTVKPHGGEPVPAAVADALEIALGRDLAVRLASPAELAEALVASGSPIAEPSVAAKFVGEIAKSAIDMRKKTLARFAESDDVPLSARVTPGYAKRVSVAAAVAAPTPASFEPDTLPRVAPASLREESPPAPPRQEPAPAPAPAAPSPYGSPLAALLDSVPPVAAPDSDPVTVDVVGSPPVAPLATIEPSAPGAVEGAGLLRTSNKMRSEPPEAVTEAALTAPDDAPISVDPVNIEEVRSDPPAAARAVTQPPADVDQDSTMRSTDRSPPVAPSGTDTPTARPPAKQTMLGMPALERPAPPIEAPPSPTRAARAEPEQNDAAPRAISSFPPRPAAVRDAETTPIPAHAAEDDVPADLIPRPTHIPWMWIGVFAIAFFLVGAGVLLLVMPKPTHKASAPAAATASATPSVPVATPLARAPIPLPPPAVSAPPSPEPSGAPEAEAAPSAAPAASTAPAPPPPAPVPTASAPGGSPAAPKPTSAPLGPTSVPPRPQKRPAPQTKFIPQGI